MLMISILLQEEIDSAQPPTPQKKTTLFINKLLRSGKQSYSVFKEILLERGCDDVVKLMENTRPDSMYLLQIGHLQGFDIYYRFSACKVRSL